LKHPFGDKVENYLREVSTYVKELDETIGSDFAIHCARYQTVLFNYEAIKSHGGGERILEIGVDRGYIARYMMRDSRYTGVDIALDNVLFDAVRRSSIVFDLEEIPRGRALPFPSELFDLVVMTEVFEHLNPNAIQKIMEEIGRVLVRGGILLFSTPNAASLENRIALLAGGLRKYRKGGIHHPVHSREYTHKELLIFFQELNFKIERLSFESSRAFVTINRRGLADPIPVYKGIFTNPSWTNLLRLVSVAPKALFPSFRETIYLALKKTGCHS
jgi:SAM-dependent methyltransferase